jgi:hypothetical protein
MGSHGIPLGIPVAMNRFRREERTMKPMAAAVAGALISGVAMYAVGAGASQNDAFVETPAQALVQPLEPQQPRAMFVSNRPAATQRVVRTQSQSRPVYRTADQSDDVVVYREPEVERRDERTKTKTALIIGGSAASGAGVGAIVGGKKGALIGAALGGGAASIYEATKRR